MSKDEIVAAIASHVYQLKCLTEQYFAVVPDSADDADLSELRERRLISVRSYNSLKRAYIDTIGEMRQHLENDHLKGIKNLGKRSILECEEIIAKIDRGEIKL
jgi:DNA-directed RNA polymerase alpha subunit